MSTPNVSQTSRLLRFGILVGVVATATVVGSADVRAKPTPAQKCAAAKRRLVGRKIAALTDQSELRCEGEHPLSRGLGQGRERRSRRVRQPRGRDDD
jgi:hypothetical protein